MAMNPNAAMANMNPMGGPVGSAPMPMMNNGGVNPQAAAAARQQQLNDNQRGVLNTYIYEYFLRYGMYDCARSLLNSDQQVNVKDGKNGAVNGAGDDAMETDSKDDIDSKTPEDLPAPKLPMPASDTSFLYEWFCLFWDIFNAQRPKGSGNGSVNQYVLHTQELLRGMRPDAQQAYQAQMARNMPGGMANMKQGSLVRAAVANNQNPQMQMLQAKNQMQRDPSSMANQDRPSSPATGEGAPSPSAKRQRTDGPGMNQQLANTQGAQQAQAILAAHGVNPQTLTPAQLATFANTPPSAQLKSIAAYSANLQNQHVNQMGGAKPGMPNVPGGPQNQGSPMVQQGADGSTLSTFYNTPEIGGPIRPGAPGGGQGAGSNHALQDYQMQLMLLEQQNKKRLMMARQEQDSMGGAVPRDGPPGQAAPNGQFPDTSPQAMRSGASPNPGDQIKRGTPQMNNSGIPSPVPEGGQSRDSPNPAMNFMGNQVDPNMAPHFFKGMEGNMAGAQAQMNGMRPPSSHPGQPFNQQQQQQMMAARAQGQGNPQQWQPGPNGPMGQGMPNQQAQGTPQQRAMPPPSAPAGTANANRTTASPQQAAAAPPTPNQGKKNAPKKKETKAAKDKRTAAQQKANANNAGATPAADGGEGDAAPATPMTPSFNKNGQNATGAAPATTAPAASAAATAAPAQAQDLSQNGLADNYNMVDFPGMEFANPLNTGDVLNDFDFDSFLHDGDGNAEAFDFNGTFSGMEGNEIGAE